MVSHWHLLLISRGDPGRREKCHSGCKAEITHSGRGAALSSGTKPGEGTQVRRDPSRRASAEGEDGIGKLWHLFLFPAACFTRLQ